MPPRARTPARPRPPARPVGRPARVVVPIGPPRPGTYFDPASRSFVTNGIHCRGLHRTLKAWYNLGADSVGRGEWADQFNFSRGRALGPSISEWIRRTNCNPAAMRSMTKSAQAIVNQCRLHHIRPVAIEVPVSVVGARVATAVDLIGVYGVHESRFTTWEPGPTDRYVIIEIKVSARGKWNTRCGTIPRALTGQDGMVLTPALYACIQLVATRVMYIHTFPTHNIAGMLVIHLYTDGGNLVCELVRLPEWCTTHAAPEIVKRINLERTALMAARSV